MHASSHQRHCQRSNHEHAGTHQCCSIAQYTYIYYCIICIQPIQRTPLQGNSFGSRFDLDLVGRGSLTPGTLIPGVCVFSRRALPMAAWTNGYELAALKADVDRACLILETGVNQRWRYGSYRRSPETSAEATAWEEAKVAVGYAGGGGGGR